MEISTRGVLVVPLSPLHAPSLLLLIRLDVVVGFDVVSGGGEAGGGSTMSVAACAPAFARALDRRIVGSVLLMKALAFLARLSRRARAIRGGMGISCSLSLFFFPPASGSPPSTRCLLRACPCVPEDSGLQVEMTGAKKKLLAHCRKRRKRRSLGLLGLFISSMARGSVTELKVAC